MSFIASLGDWLRKISRSFSDVSINGRNIVLTRHNGDTETITTQDTDTTYNNATQSADGLMSANDKTKLDGIATGAEVNQHAFSNIQVGPATVSADSKTDTLTLGPGAGVIISANTTNDSITIGCVEASQSVPGIMSTADKIKLDGITSGAEPNQNAFSNVKVGSTTIAADGKTDTLELVAGSNITLTPDATNDKVTIAATDTVTTVSTSGSGNAVTSITASNGALTVKKDASYITANDNAASATKLKDARNISVGNRDYVGFARFNGTADVTLNVTAYNAIVTVGNTNNYPYHYIGTTDIQTGNYFDGVITLLVDKGFYGGGYGICRIKARTNNASGGAVAGCEVEWLVRTSDLAVDAIQVGFRNTAADSIWDIFYKSAGIHHCAIIRTLGINSRTEILRRFTLCNSSEVSNTTASSKGSSVGAYANINDAVAEKHSGKAYTHIVTPTDKGVVADANTVNGHTVNIDVPSSAKFTDTVYTHPTTSGNKHVPSGGTSKDALIWDANGTAKWGLPTYINTTAETSSGERPIWFSYLNDNQRAVYNDNFVFNPSNGAWIKTKNRGWGITNGTYSMLFNIGESGVHRGLWDYTLDKWVVYADETKCYFNGYELNKSVPADAKFTDTVTTVSTSGSGNAVTSITASDGALTVKKDGTFLPLSGGTMTGTIYSNSAYLSARLTDAERLVLLGSSRYNKNTGAHLELRGANYVNDGGIFSLCASNANGLKYLIGKPDGSLTWTNSAVVTVKDMPLSSNVSTIPYTFKIKLPNGLMLQAYYNNTLTTDSNGRVTWTYGEAFKEEPFVQIQKLQSSQDFNLYSVNSSRVILRCNNMSGTALSSGTTVWFNVIAIGRWK